MADGGKNGIESERMRVGENSQKEKEREKSERKIKSGGGKNDGKGWRKDENVTR